MKEKRHIMFVTGSLCDGGAERVISILASGCADLGENVSLVVMRNKKDVYPVSARVNLIHLQTKKGSASERVRALRGVIKETAPDVIIPFLPVISLYTLFAAFGMNKKIIFSERADPSAKKNLKNTSPKDLLADFAMRKLGFFGRADHMVFQTPDAQSYYSKKIQKKSTIIPNPLDTEHLPQRFTGERRREIVAAGRFSEEKNFPMLFHAFAEFHKHHPEYHLTVYGEGSLRNAYEEQIKALGIENAVSMPGFASGLPEKICDAAMYVSASNHEGISNSMLEALGMGIPSIVTDCPVGGARMFVKTDENGILIPMNDREALLSAMRKIAEDVAYAEKISMNATKIRNELAKENICKQWLELC